MAVISVTTYTDPACPRSWAAQPAMVRVLSEFDAQVRDTYVMAGLAREIPDRLALDVARSATGR
ncbi:MAG: hypothetical protein JWO02_1472 [Solirubrobacterales bacterium]|nr:hypothetical protein [Solirubrobacterales bacterium]